MFGKQFNHCVRIIKYIVTHCITYNKSDDTRQQKTVLKKSFARIKLH